MRRWTATLLVLALAISACSEVDRVANCTELQNLMLQAEGFDDEEAIDHLMKISDKGSEMAADALARGADGEWLLCDTVSNQAVFRAIEIGLGS